MGDYSIEGHRYHDKHKSSSKRRHKHSGDGSGRSGSSHRRRRRHHESSNQSDFNQQPAGYDFGGEPTPIAPEAPSAALAPQSYNFGGAPVAPAQFTQQPQFQQPAPAPEPEDTYDGGASLLMAALQSGKTLEEIDEAERQAAREKRRAEKRERERIAREERERREEERRRKARARQRRMKRSSSRRHVGGRRGHDDRGDSHRSGSGHHRHHHRHHDTVHRRVVQQMFVPRQVYTDQNGKLKAHLGCCCLLLITLGAVILANTVFGFLYGWRCNLDAAVVAHTFTLSTSDIKDTLIDIGLDYGMVDIRQDKTVAPGTIKVVSQVEGAASTISGFTFTPTEEAGLTASADSIFSIKIAQEGAPNPWTCNHARVKILLPYGGDELINTDIRVQAQFVVLEAANVITRSVTVSSKYIELTGTKVIVAGSLFLDAKYRMIANFDELSVGWTSAGFISDATLIVKGMYQTLSFNKLIAPESAIEGSFGSQFYDGVTIGPALGFMSKLAWFGTQDMFLYGTEDYQGHVEVTNTYGYLSFSQLARDGIVAMTKPTSSMIPGLFAGSVHASDDEAQNAKLFLQNTFGKTFTMIKN